MLADLAQHIAQDLSRLSERAKAEAPLNTDQLQTLIQSALRQCNLVTREEFDAQSAVLARTREKLDRLEQQLVDYERMASHNDKTP